MSETICADCKQPKSNHPYRHPFVPQAFNRPVAPPVDEGRQLSADALLTAYNVAWTTKDAEQVIALTAELHRRLTATRPTSDAAPPLAEHLRPERQACIAKAVERVIPIVQDVARNHGYAIGVHGSLTRDIDLLAVPWTEDAWDAEGLVQAITREVGGYVRDAEAATEIDGAPFPRLKPHGRRSWSIHVAGGTYIDLSVMPLAAHRSSGAGALNEALTSVGNQMSNLCFNGAQSDRVPDDYRNSMDDLRKQWDEARAAARAEKEG